jgi:hypothetical protein
MDNVKLALSCCSPEAATHKLGVKTATENATTATASQQMLDSLFASAQMPEPPFDTSKTPSSSPEPPTTTIVSSSSANLEWVLWKFAGKMLFSTLIAFEFSDHILIMSALTLLSVSTCFVQVWEMWS